MPNIIDPEDFREKQQEGPSYYATSLRLLDSLNITPPRVPPPTNSIRLPALPPFHRKKKKKPRTNEIGESLSIAIVVANVPIRVRNLSEAQVARENAHREMARRRKQKERAKVDKQRNEVIAKEVGEKFCRYEGKRIYQAKDTNAQAGEAIFEEGEERQQ